MMANKMILLCFVAGLLASCDNDDSSPRTTPKPRKDIILSRAEQDMADKGTDFAFRFFNQVCNSEKTNTNVFVSPLSASLALSMTANGAAGNTLTEMTNVLGFSSSLNDMNSYHQKLTSALLDLDNTIQLEIANSIWVKKGFRVYDSFVSANKEWYDADVRELDFSSSAATDVINKWCADKTNQRIKKVLDNIPGDARLFLINALYFKGEWTSKFKSSATAQEDFTNADGSGQKVAMMNQTATFNYSHNDDFSIAEFPYGNQAFSMVVLLPEAGKTLDECLPQLTYKHWKTWSEQMGARTLEVKFPKFELIYSKDFVDDMQAMGMKDAFHAGNADFTKMSAADLFIGILKQYTYLKIDEEGTEAAAVTVTGMIETSVGPSTTIPFYMNRPFIIMIKEKSTGSILFMGKITTLKSH